MEGGREGGREDGSEGGGRERKGGQLLYSTCINTIKM